MIVRERRLPARARRERPLATLDAGRAACSRCRLLSALDTRRRRRRDARGLAPRASAATRSWSSGARRSGSARGSSSPAATTCDRGAHAACSGRGALTDVRLLGGRSLDRRARRLGAPSERLGCRRSSRRIRTTALRRSGRASSGVIGVAGDGEPGRGHWLFTPAPLYLALAATERELGRPRRSPRRSRSCASSQLALRGRAERLLRCGSTTRGTRASTASSRRRRSLLTPASPDPYDGPAPSPRRPRRARLAPPPAPREQPAWWSEPIFCGWGAQCHLAGASGGHAGDFATQDHYDGFLDTSRRARRSCPARSSSTTSGRRPTARNEPDPREVARPDAAGSPSGTRDGQHVLLWWKAWDPEGAAARAVRPEPGRRAGRARPRQSRRRATSSAAIVGAHARRRTASTPTG